MDAHFPHLVSALKTTARFIRPGCNLNTWKTSSERNDPRYFGSAVKTRQAWRGRSVATRVVAQQPTPYRCRKASPKKLWITLSCLFDELIGKIPTSPVQRSAALGWGIFLRVASPGCFLKKSVPGRTENFATPANLELIRLSRESLISLSPVANLGPCARMPNFSD